MTSALICSAWQYALGLVTIMNVFNEFLFTSFSSFLISLLAFFNAQSPYPAVDMDMSGMNMSATTSAMPSSTGMDMTSMGDMAMDCKMEVCNSATLSVFKH
jgi:hypothetical protein